MPSITTVDSKTQSGTGANGQTLLTGFPTAGSFVNAPLYDSASCTIGIGNVFTGTLQFEGSIDLITWIPVKFAPYGVDSTFVTTTTLPGFFHGNVTGFAAVRVRATAFSSGTADISFKSSDDADFGQISSGSGSGGGAVPSLNYTRTDKSGNTGATPNTYVQVCASNTSRKKWFIQNDPNNTANITVGYGNSGSETTMVVLQPGQTISESIVPIGTERIAVKSSGTSVIFWAHEG